MRLAVINWPLVLEFTKVLAGPTTTVAVAVIVGLFATRSYRRQKALEKRLEWYERSHVALERVSMAYWQFGSRTESAADPVKDQELISLVRELQAQIYMAWLYATPKGFEAMYGANADLAAIHQSAEGRNLTRDELKQVLEIINRAAIVLANDTRRELGMAALSPSLKALGKTLGVTA